MRAQKPIFPLPPWIRMHQVMQYLHQGLLLETQHSTATIDFHLVQILIKIFSTLMTLGFYILKVKAISFAVWLYRVF